MAYAKNETIWDLNAGTDPVPVTARIPLQEDATGEAKRIEVQGLLADVTRSVRIVLVDTDSNPGGVAQWQNTTGKTVQIYGAVNKIVASSAACTADLGTTADPSILPIANRIIALGVDLAFVPPPHITFGPSNVLTLVNEWVTLSVKTGNPSGLSGFLAITFSPVN